MHVGHFVSAARSCRHLVVEASRWCLSTTVGIPEIKLKLTQQKFIVTVCKFSWLSAKEAKWVSWNGVLREGDIEVELRWEEVLSMDKLSL
jgi:hypothetical protein